MLFCLKGCGSVFGLLPKKCLSLLFLSKLSRDSDNFVRVRLLLGTKVKPRDRTSICGTVRVFVERLVMYCSLFSNV